MANTPVKIFDTTLRDGLQSPNIHPITLAGRVAIGEALHALGVDVIEAGFAIGSELDSQTIKTLAEKKFDTTICALARTLKADIDAAGDALKDAPQARIHTFISTSPLHREKKLGMDKQQVLEQTQQGVRHALSYVDDVQFSLEDYTRTEPDFAYQVIDTAIKAGATTINLPDTVGYSTPDEYAGLIKGVINNVEGIDKAILSTHCHDDLGLAVANSLAGVQSGARQIECSINGIGERAGNAAMEELVMALQVRADILPFSTRIKTENFMTISQLVQELTGLAVQKNKAIVGQNAFAHESGIHQHGINKDRRTYEILTPESVGQSASQLTLGVTSGRSGLLKKLEQLGFNTQNLTPEKATEIYLAFMAQAAEKRMTDDDISTLAGKYF